MWQPSLKYLFKIYCEIIAFNASGVLGAKNTLNCDSLLGIYD